MKSILNALLLYLLLAALTGLAYPLAITALAGRMFPAQAEGSLVRRGDQVIGSLWIGQAFASDRYLWSRPSATGGHACNALDLAAGACSSGSNLGPLAPELAARVAQELARLRAADPLDRAQVPVDLVTCSASGLDPHISLAAAEYQLARIARARELPLDEVRRAVFSAGVPRQLGLLGEPVVHVLAANLALDELQRRGQEARAPLR